MRPIQGVEAKRGSMVDPAIEKYLLSLQRAMTQGDLSSAEMKLLRQLYPQFLIALRRLRSLGRERAVRMDFEECLRQLPLPTMLLRWNLKLIYRNRAARNFCAVWEKGPAEQSTDRLSLAFPRP